MCIKIIRKKGRVRDERRSARDIADKVIYHESARLIKGGKMKIKTFTSGGYSLEAAMEGLESKINNWLNETQLKGLTRLKYNIVQLNDAPYATAMVAYE